MLRTTIILIAAVFLQFTGCRKPVWNQSSHTVDFSPNDSLLTSLQGLIGTDINMCENRINKLFIGKNISVMDSIIVSDEGTEWPSKVVLLNGDMVLVIESSWYNSTAISVISIVGKNIAIYGKVRVGDLSRNIKIFANKKLPSLPDGEVALQDKYNLGVWYFFKVDEVEQEKLYFGVTDIDKVPDDLELDYIMIK